MKLPLFFPLIAALWASLAGAAEKPSVLLIYIDDLGWGDLSCYGAKALTTPHVDRLAAEGLRFTDGHSTSGTCTPSRYALLTGEYPWRKRGTGVLPGNAGLIIEPERGTLPLTLKQAGYATGAIGKWHLGLGPATGPDWNAQINPGAKEVGYDSSYLMAATGDRVPCVYVENGRVEKLDPADPIVVDYLQPIPGKPTGQSNPELLRMHPSHGHDMAIVNGISRIGHMKGGTAALWKDEDMADIFVQKATQFIDTHHDHPFFLYFGTQDIHVPRVPHPRFAGKSGMGPRGDAIIEMDWCVGELLTALEKHHLRERTLIIFTSDNGPVIDDGYRDDAVEKLGTHRPAGPWRGGKYSNFEGGTRVPFICTWAGRIKPGVSDALVSQIDLHASLAALVGVNLAQPRDSQNILPALLGESATGRSTSVADASTRSLRQGPWKLIPPRQGPARLATTNTETGSHPAPQLYNLSTDPGETQNLANTQPERIAAMLDTLHTIESTGRMPPPLATAPK
jgi:arylsulfatase A-like enzyme